MTFVVMGNMGRKSYFCIVQNNEMQIVVASFLGLYFIHFMRKLNLLNYFNRNFFVRNTKENFPVYIIINSDILCKIASLLSVWQFCLRNTCIEMRTLFMNVRKLKSSIPKTEKNERKCCLISQCIEFWWK